MKHLYGGILITWVALELVLQPDTEVLSIAILLGLLCLFIVKEKFFDNKNSTIIYAVIVFALSQYNIKFMLLASILIFDLLYYRRYLLGALALFITFIISYESGYQNISLHLILALLLGYILGEKDNNEKNYMLLLDKERRLRYRLEETQNELINSRKEIEHLTEIRERNRIAHQIHDSVGHSIAGVIFQIEAARRILYTEKEKLEEILKLCSQKLAEALELTRNTVYNIKADKKMGLELLEKIINDFRFCPVKFEHSG
ncbi:MAG: histidine kinase, partial [Bacillota bacterium]|nr:histidine kinase [Bacillota bacterium]